MNNISSEIFLELGSSKKILSFNDKINNKIKSKEKNILNDQKQDSLFLNLKKNKIENIIYELEKENNIYIKNINLLVDRLNTYAEDDNYVGTISSIIESFKP